MKLDHRLRRCLSTGVAVATLAVAALAAIPPASAASGSAVGTLAVANIGKSAGTCADTPTHNSLGGAEFANSCAGGGELWCADFALWTWANSGFATTGLTAAAGSFYTYGQTNGTLHTSASYVPKAGDAIVYNYTGGGVAAHVGVVTSVSSNGNVVTANGDWNGVSGQGDKVFSDTSEVAAVTIADSQRAVGSIPSSVDPADGYKISAYVSPVVKASTNPYTAAQVCGSGYSVVDSYALTGATVYLLYDASSGDNCVTTLAVDPSKAEPMNATLAVEGGASAANPGTFTYYAGPVVEHAPDSCVEWGGSYESSTWTSKWSHC